LLGCIFWWFGRLFWWRPAWPALTGQPPSTFDFQLNMFIKLLNCNKNGEERYQYLLIGIDNWYIFIIIYTCIDVRMSSIYL
jgi:hypothetical protein